MPDKIKSPFGAAVRPDNVRPSARRDPDAAPPPDPDPVPAATAPDGPGPTDPTPDPVPSVPPHQPRPAPQQPASAVAPRDGGTLASVLTAPRDQDHPVSEGVAALAGLAAMSARPRDPMQDWAPDGTRHLRWIGAAIRQFATLTGRKTQDVQRDAMLGVEPIPADILDAQFYHHYGYPREQYKPEAYR